MPLSLDGRFMSSSLLILQTFNEFNSSFIGCKITERLYSLPLFFRRKKLLSNLHSKWEWHGFFSLFALFLRISFCKMIKSSRSINICSGTRQNSIECNTLAGASAETRAISMSSSNGLIIITKGTTIREINKYWYSYCVQCFFFAGCCNILLTQIHSSLMLNSP